MIESRNDLERFQEMLKRIDFTIPNNTSSRYYINAIQAMIERGCNISFEQNRVIIWDDSNKSPDGISEIELFFGSLKGKVGLLFKIKLKQKDTGTEVENVIEAQTVKEGILSEREQLSFSYMGDFYRYDYLREYEMDGTCVYHNSRDLAQRLSSSAKLYDKGVLISLFDIKTNSKKSIVLLGDYVGDKRREISSEIKKGKIFQKINSPEGKEVPYKPYPFSQSEFEKILLKV